MALFQVFQHPEGGYEAIKRGFSWPAFFFELVWAMVKRLWAVVGAMLLAILGTSFALSSIAGPSPEPDPDLILLWGLAIKFFLGAFGNDWVRRDAERRGFEHVQDVEAANPRAAIETWLNEPQKPNAA